MTTDWKPDSAVTCETFVLKTDGVGDLDDFSANYSKYLISTIDEPKEAAQAWRKQAQKHPVEGRVSLRLGEQELAPATLWCDLEGFWLAIIETADAHLKGGAGEAELSDQPVVVSLRSKGTLAEFRILDSAAVVEPEPFLQSLLAGADNFYAWVEEHIGGIAPEVRKNIAELSQQRH
ncbi:hypothetical protein [Micrococcoides hystricis]|uniref:Uncharacterized protein n=1 Tax=Micrococcoides hystricis TaxID=1572761 RepID=A0ABV6PCI4_9MICC